ncbi:MAG: hypothetical protein NTX51_10945, partial [Verrucomicrobia bacterium]|nr:hypothetical protein [Verrucomicrobiota bacterium]
VSGGHLKANAVPLAAWLARIGAEWVATVTATQTLTQGPQPWYLVRLKVVITRHEKAVARLVPEGGANLARTRQAVAELRAGRLLMAKRRGVKPLTDREIKDSTWPVGV